MSGGSPDLESLLAAERVLPDVPLVLRERLYGRLRVSLGLLDPGGGSGGGGAFGASSGAPGGATMWMVAALVAGAVAVLIVSMALRDGRSDAPTPMLAPPAASGAGSVDQRHEPWPPPRFQAGATIVLASDASAAAGPTAPEWFGQRDVAPRRIAGRVLEDGRSAAGATVTLESFLSNADPGFSRTVLSDEDGRFDFGPRTAWYYLVTASLPGRRAASTWLHLSDPTNHPASDALRLEIGPCTARIAGNVVDETGGGITAEIRISEPSYAGIAGAGVQTDPAGRFELCRPSGPARLLVRAEGFGTVYLRTIASGDPMRVEIRLAPEGVVEGTALRVETGAPVAGAQVSVTELNPPERYRTRPADVMAISDAQGRFVLRGLAAGRYRIEAWSADAMGFDEGRADARVDVQAGRTTRGARARLHTTSVVETLVRAHGQPLPGFTMRLCRRGTAACSFGVVTQADGRATIHGVLAGDNEFNPLSGRILAPLSITVGQAAPRVIEVEAETAQAVRLVPQ